VSRRTLLVGIEILDADIVLPQALLEQADNGD
jgi:hypothetical protein